MIKNPGLASALIKMDDRLADVQEIILMSDENWTPIDDHINFYDAKSLNIYKRTIYRVL